MSTALAIFVKTPELSPVKTRLAKTIGKESAIRFYESFVRVIESKIGDLTQSPDVDIIPYWAIAEKDAIRNPRWQKLNRIHTGEGGLGERLHNVYSNLRKMHDNVIMIGSDSPQISCEHIIEAKKSLEKNGDFIIGPAKDGGFYLFAGNKEIRESSWTDISYSMETTMADLIKKLEPLAKIEFLESLTDIDHLDDLVELFEEQLLN